MTSELFSAAVENVHGYRDVRPADLRVPPRGVRIIDVREPAEFTGELGHVPGAELVPLASLPTAAASWARDAALLVVCRSGGRSARAAMQLRAMGFARVMNLAGGMLAYGQAGLPVERAGR